MPLSIRNPEVDRLARELAAETGTSVTEAIRQAVAHELDRLRADRTARTAARRHSIDALLADLDRLPVLDPRLPDEIIGYGPSGLPE